MKRYLFVVFFFSQVSVAFACLDAYQFKIFPVGMCGKTIVTVDFQISRTDSERAIRMFKLPFEEAVSQKEMFIMIGFLSTYDQYQKLLSIQPLDTTFSLGKDYGTHLNASFRKGLQKIKDQFQGLEHFDPQYLSFCDFQQSCQIVEIEKDRTSDAEFLIYNGQKYEVPIVKDTAYFGFNNSPYYNSSIGDMHLSSIRVYKSASITLVVNHLATGHELAMGYITSDPDEARDNERKTLAKEYQPDFLFASIENSTYEEPLLHHGYGFDVFLLKE